MLEVSLSGSGIQTAKTKIREKAFPLSSLFFMIPSVYEVIECSKSALQMTPVAAYALMFGAAAFFIEEVVGMTTLVSKKINAESVERISSGLGQAASLAYTIAGIAMRDYSLVASGIIFGLATYNMLRADKSAAVIPAVPKGASLGRRIAIHLHCLTQNIKNRSMPKSAALEVVGVAASASALYNILPASAATAIIGMEFIGVSFLAMADGAGHIAQHSAPIETAMPIVLEKALSSSIRNETLKKHAHVPQAIRQQRSRNYLPVLYTSPA